MWYRTAWLWKSCRVRRIHAFPGKKCRAFPLCRAERKTKTKAERQTAAPRSNPLQTTTAVRSRLLCNLMHGQKASMWQHVKGGKMLKKVKEMSVATRIPSFHPYIKERAMNSFIQKRKNLEKKGVIFV